MPLEATKPATSSAFVASSGIFSKSSSFRMTYWPFAYSKPFTISFESTGTLSFGQMYGRFRAVMHVACNVVKERSFVSVAPYSLTGMFTSPNATAPPKKVNAALIIVIVVVVVVLVSVVLAAALYLLTSTLIEPPPPPMVVFGAVEQSAGNATIPIASSSREISPSNLQVRLSADTSGSSRGMPPPNGSVVLIAGGRTLRVVWLDADSDQGFGTGDAIRVTADSAPLPYSTMFRFDLMTSSGR